jgi:hypothetical protein
MDFEGDCTRDLLRLAQRAMQDDSLDKGVLCTAVVQVIDNPPRDGVLRSLADGLCQAVIDWARFEGSSARLQDAVEGYTRAVSAMKVDEQLNKLRA